MFDAVKSKEQKSRKIEYHRRQQSYVISHCTGDVNFLDFEGHTLFVNAAIQGTEEHPLQLPWLVDIELPSAVPW